MGTEKGFKLLGIFFDEYLSFEHHIAKLHSKLSRALYMIKRVKHMLPKTALRTLYFALIHSNLNYCLNIYSCATQTTLSKIVKKQKEAIRVISNAQYRQHTAPLFKDLKILPLEKMMELGKLKVMHDYTQDRLPISFAETWITNRQHNPDHNLRNADNFIVPPHNRESFKRFPLYTFPLTWNRADDNKYIPNKYTFIRSQKDRLINSIV